MKTLSLTGAPIDWRALVEEVQRTGEGVALELDGVIYGVVLPHARAAQVVARYDAHEAPVAPDAPPQPFIEPPTYLDLLRDDPSLVPVIDGQSLEFMTMMNSSYVDPRQIYQFKHPKTGHIYIYNSTDLQAAIGRHFARVEFIPLHPKAFVEGKR